MHFQNKTQNAESSISQCLTVLICLPLSECGGGPDASMVLLAVVGSILLVGVVLLGVWKLVITIHDRREFARFQSARSRARYEMVRVIRSAVVFFTVICWHLFSRFLVLQNLLIDIL